MNYTEKELTEAKRQITSTLRKLQETVNSLESKVTFTRYKSQITLAKRRIDAFEIALNLIEEALKKCKASEPLKINSGSDKIELLSNLEKVHTTDLGAQRIRKNLLLDIDDVVDWCKKEIIKAGALIFRKGKNWYINVDGNEITVNAYTYTIITAHRKK